MDRKECKEAIGKEYKKLEYHMKKNGMVALTGIVIACGILMYDSKRMLNITYQLATDPLVKELNASKKAGETKKQEMLGKILENKYLPKVKIGKNVQKFSVGLAVASGLYMLGGLGIPLFAYIKKRKSLEKQVEETSSE